MQRALGVIATLKQHVQPSRRPQAAWGYQQRPDDPDAARLCGARAAHSTRGRCPQDRRRRSPRGRGPHPAARAASAARALQASSAGGGRPGSRQDGSPGTPVSDTAAAGASLANPPPDVATAQYTPTRPPADVRLT